ncbi:MAG: ATP-dependent DNA helicase DinG [Spirochaetes bacterium]|nr:ATP-dependent DNA helicase DinG [Spirochaetota bacterium]
MVTWESSGQAAASRLGAKAREELRKAIALNRNREVFAVGSLDGSGLVSEIEIVARGTEDKVPALEAYFEKGGILIHNHPSGFLHPSEADVDIAAEAGSYGVGSYIVDNEVEEVYIVAEPARRKAIRTLDEEGLAGALDAGGKLSEKLDSFEPRPSQIAMARDVAGLFNRGGILAAEAGTGVGKSFAYLVPALAWAQGNEERVIVSTATINLQDQLFSKDIPLVSSAFKRKLKAVLVKGRSNYLCKRRLAEAIEEEGLLVDEESPLSRLLAWDKAGGSGDRAELSFRVDDASWAKVCSEADSCLSLRCPQREACHVIAVRRNAADAQVIVVNHHLLFADIAARRKAAGLEQTSILPAYSALILDEAHVIESSATSLFTESLTRPSLLKKLSRLWRRTRGGQFGVFAKLAALPGSTQDWTDGLDEEVRIVQSTFAELEAGALRLIGTEGSLRLTTALADTVQAFREPAGRLQRALLALTKRAADCIASLPDSVLQEPSVYETRIASRSLGEAADLIARLKDFESDLATVYWLEKTRSSQREIFVSFNATPLEVAGLLQKSVFEKVRTVVCTSATLAVGGSFDFWMKRVGIDKGREDVETKSYPSPFPFSTNALLAIDPEAPHPQKAKERYKEYLGGAVLDLLMASRGRALVLFTSYDLLGHCYEVAKPALEKQGITCLRQGMDDRSRLLTLFRNDISSVLFATDSFWEGVDAPGETLSMVVIAKLPFKVPSDPIQQARAEAVEARGGNAFVEISVPEAIIKFKQGFGRLIRHSEDRGVAVVLDQRLASSSYGSLFIESLPHCRLLVDSLSIIEKEVKHFLDD